MTMKSRWKSLIIGFIEKIHFKAFGHPMSLEMKSFLGNLSWSFVAGALVLPLMMIVTTLAGRLMGPTEYGKYSLLVIINQFLIIFIFFGLDTTSVKYIAKARSFSEKKRVISTITSFVFLILALLIGLSILSFPILLKYSREYLIFVLIVVYYTAIISVKTIFDLVIRGIEQFKRQALGKALEVCTVLISFLIVFLVFKFKNFLGLLFVLNLGAITISIYYYFQLSKYLGKINKKVLIQQLGEGKLFFISALLGTLFLSIDRLVVARYLGVNTLGIYSAYYFASFGVVSQLTQLFTNVFFPVTSRLKDKSFTKKIDRLLAIGSIPLTIFFGLLMTIMLLFFGKDYPMNLWHIIGFSVFSMLYFFQGLYNTVIVDVNKSEYKKYLIARNTVSVVTIILYVIIILLHKITIPIIITTLIFNMLLTIFIERLFIKDMQQR